VIDEFSDCFHCRYYNTLKEDLQPEFSGNISSLYNN
jgi:hypothetical protein